MRATALAFAALCMLWGAAGPAVADVGNYEFLSSISPKERASMLATAVRTITGSQCDYVSWVVFKGMDINDDSRYYAINCAESGDWLIRLKNGGVAITSVIHCSVLDLVSVPCWAKF